MDDQVEPQTIPPAEKKTFNLSPEKVTIVSIVAFLFLLFGGIVVFSQQHAGSVNTSTASPQPNGLFQAGDQSNLSSQVAGAQTKQQQAQYGVQKPTVTVPPKPTSTPEPSASPTPSPSPSPSASPSDSEGPKISGVGSENVENNKATVKFSLSEEGDAKIEYGDSTSYGKTKEVSEKKTSHSLEITELDANKTYHFRIVSKDAAGNSTTSGDNEFTTKP